VPQNDEHRAEQKTFLWWLTSGRAMPIFAALVAVGALLFIFRDYYVERLIARPVTLLEAATVVAAIVLLIRLGQQYDWTGFAAKRTLWAWLDLLVVPLVLAGIGFGFAMQQDARQQALEQQRAYDSALQGYLDQMSTLVLEDLSNSKIRILMRARTLTVLERLNPSRKAQVMRFLAEAELVGARSGDEEPIISLDGHLKNPEVTGADLSGADLSRLTLAGIQLAAADLSDANLQSSFFDTADLESAYLQGANLRETVLVSAELQDARLQDAHLQEAYLSDADLSGADLRGAHLRRADLSGADLSGAHLRGAHLSDADLSGADLSDAQLRWVNLYVDNLSGANLSGADLKNARGWTAKQLRAANQLEGATMPDGQILKSEDNSDGPTFEEWLKSKDQEENKKSDGSS
jgi:uncharacterized protein YjbI with pentapeptide repeats